jgi:hypothetical protein
MLLLPTPGRSIQNARKTGNSSPFASAGLSVRARLIAP